MEANFDAIQKALANYLEGWAHLKKLGIVNNKKDFTSQLGEFLVANLYQGTPSESSIQKDWDLELADGKKVQVKAHAKAFTNKNKWTPVPYQQDASIDLYIIVVFTEGYKLKHFFDVPWEVLWERSTQDKARRLIRWNKLFDYDRMNQQDFRTQGLVVLFSR